MSDSPQPFWSKDADHLLIKLKSRRSGLSDQEAETRRLGQIRPQSKDQYTAVWLFLSQLKSPITLVLVFAAGLSFCLDDHADALILLSIIVASALLGFWQEYSAASTLKQLLALVTTRATVLRDGHERSIRIEELVCGDIIVLAAGEAVPADCLLMDSRDLFVNEAALTGETFPVEKQPGILPIDMPLAKRTNSLFQGTSVVSGTAQAIVVTVGDATQFGAIAAHLKLRSPETGFERGIRWFGYFLMEVTLLLVVAIFSINVFFAKPVIDSLMFSLALAVGLTPQLLPAIITVNLAYGAARMAERKVIVRKLSSIENFGSMNVLFSDKTGTLTQGIMQLHRWSTGWGSRATRSHFTCC